MRQALKSVHLSTIAPIRFVFPKGPIQVGYRFKKPRLAPVEEGGKAGRQPVRISRSSKESLSTVARRIGANVTNADCVYVFEPVVVEVNLGQATEAINEVFPGVGDLAKNAGFSPREALEVIAEAMALGQDDKIDDPDLWKKLKEEGRAAVLADHIREHFNIPDSVKPGASPKDLLENIATAQLLGADESDPRVHEDIDKLSTEDLIKKYISTPGDGSDSHHGDSGDGSGTDTTTGDDDSHLGAAGGSDTDVMDGHGADVPSSGSSTSSGDSASSSGSTSADTSGDTGTSDASSSSAGGGRGYAPTPGVSVDISDVNPLAENSDVSPDDSFVIVTVDPDDPSQPADKPDDDDDGGDDDDDGGDDGGDDDGDDDDDDDRDDVDTTGRTDSTGVSGYTPDPDEDTGGKTWDELTPEERQAILLIVQAKKNSLILHVDPDDASSTDVIPTTAPVMTWREKLAPYIYPTDDDGDSVPLPDTPGSAVFDKIVVVGGLPDPSPVPSAID